MHAPMIITSMQQICLCLKKLSYVVFAIFIIDYYYCISFSIEVNPPIRCIPVTQTVVFLCGSQSSAHSHHYTWTEAIVPGMGTKVLVYKLKLKKIINRKHLQERRMKHPTGCHFNLLFFICMNDLWSAFFQSWPKCHVTQCSPATCVI